MAGARRVRTFLAAVIAGALGVGRADASGGYEEYPWYISADGGNSRELQRLYAGQLGVVMAGSDSPLLYLDWRVLHGLKVGPVAGPALSTECCTPAPPTDGMEGGVYGWLEARKLVVGAPELPPYLSTERTVDDYMVVPNCFRDAFDTAIATLKDRVTRHGAGSPAVQAWLAGQDAVFKACHDEGVEMPPIMPNQPGWLRADRAYQSAALALYNGFNDAAAERFAGIAQDPNSPWRPMGLYLQARAIQREALAKPSPAIFVRSRTAINALAAAPDGTYAKDQAPGMLRALAYRDQPDRLLVQLTRELAQAEPAPDIAFAFRDYLALGRKAADKPEIADWIDTLNGRGVDTDINTDANVDIDNALTHARERWTRTHDVAWLIAALALVQPDNPAAKALAGDAARVPADHPGWLTAQYHLTRLTIAASEPAVTRARLDRILGRKTLSSSDRYLFASARLQVATGLADFTRLSTRVRSCTQACEEVLSRSHETMPTGFGEDARAVIDRMPLSQRIAVSRSASLPADLRLDVALTSYARAVYLQDDAAVDGLARDLAKLLPQMKADWTTIAATPPGPAKRYAEFFAMAKIPGLRADLNGYTRPEGGIRDFQGYWTDWIILPRGRTVAPLAPPTLGSYEHSWSNGEVASDLTCMGECGLGAFPLRLPDFVAATQTRAAAERATFVDGYEERASGEVRKLPKGSLGVWEELYAYARAHPQDPRSPETLYWLIHVTRWGPSRDHLGHRAFSLLHARYPKSSWTKRSPYYYD
jgi:hypothetical protein